MINSFKNIYEKGIIHHNFYIIRII